MITVHSLQVSRNAETATINFLLTLPTNLSIPLLGNMVKKEQVMDMMIAIKLLDKLLEVQTAPDVSPHLKEIMLGLIKVKNILKYISPAASIPGL